MMPYLTHREFESKEIELGKTLSALKKRCLSLEKQVREEVCNGCHAMYVTTVV
jgi:hypothetical protein